MLGAGWLTRGREEHRTSCCQGWTALFPCHTGHRTVRHSLISSWCPAHTHTSEHSRSCRSSWSPTDSPEQAAQTMLLSPNCFSTDLPKTPCISPPTCQRAQCPLKHRQAKQQMPGKGRKAGLTIWGRSLVWKVNSSCWLEGPLQRIIGKMFSGGITCPGDQTKQ